MNSPSIKSSRPAPHPASVIPSFRLPEDVEEPTFVEPWRKRVGEPFRLPKPADHV